MPRIDGAAQIAQRSRHGKGGRPRVNLRPNFNKRLDEVLERYRTGNVSLRQAALQLDVGVATFTRLRDGQHVSQGSSHCTTVNDGSRHKEGKAWESK